MRSTRGRLPGLEAVLEKVERVAYSTSALLIKWGRYYWRTDRETDRTFSPRYDGPFVKVNCTAILQPQGESNVKA